MILQTLKRWCILWKYSSIAGHHDFCDISPGIWCLYFPFFFLHFLTCIYFLFNLKNAFIILFIYLFLSSPLWKCMIMRLSPSTWKKVVSSCSNYCSNDWICEFQWFQQKWANEKKSHNNFTSSLLETWNVTLEDWEWLILRSGSLHLLILEIEQDTSANFVFCLKTYRPLGLKCMGRFLLCFKGSMDNPHRKCTIMLMFFFMKRKLRQNTQNVLWTSRDCVEAFWNPYGYFNLVS